MKRYLILGTNSDGSIEILGRRRSEDSESPIRDALRNNSISNLSFKQIIVIEIGDAKQVVGAALNMTVFEVCLKPQPKWTLKKL